MIRPFLSFIPKAKRARSRARFVCVYLRLYNLFDSLGVLGGSIIVLGSLGVLAVQLLLWFFLAVQFLILSACIGVHPVPMSVFQVCRGPSIMSSRRRSLERDPSAAQFLLFVFDRAVTPARYSGISCRRTWRSTFSVTGWSASARYCRSASFIMVW